MTFQPSVAGASAATLTVTAGAGAVARSASLAGTGIVVSYSASPTSLGFGNAGVGTTTTLSVAVANTGTVALPVTSIALSGTNANQFSQSNTCGTSLAVSASCTISVVFKPTASGAKSATLTLKPGSGAASTAISLTGTAIIPTYSVAPSAINIGSTLVGSHLEYTLLLTNTGSLDVPLTSAVLSGTGAGQYSVSDACGALLPVGSTCTYQIGFTPTSRGTKTATLKITAGGGAAATSVPLQGIGN